MAKTTKLIALFLAMVLIISAQAAAGVAGTPRMGMPLAIREDYEGTDWVSLYYADNGGAISGNSGGFQPSAAYPFANFKKAVSDYSAVNPDIKAWLHIPNTNMSFPVAFNNTTNAYYLYRDWKGTDYTGIINWQNWASYPDSATYLDYRAKLGTSWDTSSRNIVLYGHNWNNLRSPMGIGNYANLHMFAQLPSYTNIDFATQNPHIYLSTGEMEGIWRVFAVGYCTTTPYFFYNNPNPTKTELQTLIDEWKQRTHITFDVDVNSDDRLLTMTTCTREYGQSAIQRYVVVARLLRPGESENDKVTARANTNIKHPDFSLPTRLPASTTTTTTTTEAPDAPPNP